MRFSTQWLLRNKRIRADGTGMNFFINKMIQFEHINVSHCHFLLKRNSCMAVNDGCLAVFRQSRLFEAGAYLRLGRPVKDRRDSVESQRLRGPAQMGL